MPVMSNSVLVKIGPRTIFELSNLVPPQIGLGLGLGSAPKQRWRMRRTEIACKIGLDGTTFAVKFGPPGPILIPDRN